MSVKWGVIGACGIADRRTIPEGIMPTENAQLVALMDIDEVRLKKVAEKYGGLKYYTKEDDLINDPDVEAIYIATPTYLHHPQVLKAARAGKHILCEKPMAMNLNQAEEMIRVCEENKVKFTLDYMMRYHSHHHKIKEFIDDGTLGTLVMGRAQLTCWYPPLELTFLFKSPNLNLIYPFIAPPAKPLTNCFSIKINKTITGVTAKREAAVRYCHCTSHLPTRS